jgi:hypothetical protein
MTGSRSARMRAAAVKLTFRGETSVVAVMVQVLRMIGLVFRPRRTVRLSGPTMDGVKSRWRGGGLP